MLVDEFMPVYDVSDGVAAVVDADLSTTTGLGPTRWHRWARNQTCLFCGSRIAAGTRRRGLGRAIETRRSLPATTMSDRQARRSGPWVDFVRSTTSHDRLHGYEALSRSPSKGGIRVRAHA